MATVLVCDHAVPLRDTLVRLLATIPGITRVVMAGSGEEVLRRLPIERPSLVLLDIRTPGRVSGVRMIRDLLTRYPDTKVLALTIAEDAHGVAAALDAGAVGFLVKGATRQEVAPTLLAALAAAGHRRAALAAPAAARAASPSGGAAMPLTDREVQVLRGMARGLTNAAIGRELYMAHDTVKTHARRLFGKLGAVDRAHAVANGFRAGLIR